MLSAVGNAVRLVLLGVVTAAIGVGAYVGYQMYEESQEERRALGQAQHDLEQREVQIEAQQRTIDDLNRTVVAREQQIGVQAEQIQVQAQEIEEQQRQILRLETANRLLKVDRRVAQLRVLKQAEREGKMYTTVEFVELDPNAEDPGGRPIEEPRQFEIEGDIVHVTAHVIKFDDKFIEEGDDPLRAASLCLFRRIYGEFQKPIEGFLIDRVGERPAVYGGQEMSKVEKNIWDNFWDYANDLEKQSSAGLRAVHGEAVFTKVLPGRTYPILLRSSGGLSIAAPKIDTGVDVPKT